MPLILQHKHTAFGAGLEHGADVDDTRPRRIEDYFELLAGARHLELALPVQGYRAWFGA